MQHDAEHRMKKIRLAPIHMIPGSFLLAILAGTLLLKLPWASASGRSTDFVTALFTATTSVCVTGLVVVDTYAHWSTFGQIVILLLIQIGGLGIITVASMMMLMLRKKFTLSDRTLLQDALNVDSSSGLLKLLRRIVIGTFLVEGMGTVLYSFAFVREYGFGKGIWASAFTAVSAFCNAGIDILGPDSLVRYRADSYVLGVTMLLIILGGLGYVVWFDIASNAKHASEYGHSLRQRFKRLREHTKVVLCLTVGLIIIGAILFLITEYHNPATIQDMNLKDKILNSLFESVTLRTAGFATIPQQNLNGASSMIAYFLMFIGGSPIGTAGGVKTVTMFLVILNALSYVRGKSVTTVFNRKISNELMRKAAAIVQISFMAMIVLTVLLVLTNPVTLEDGLFEIISALATVGLTRGVTPGLNTVGRLIVIAAMYLGRIGPISMAVFFMKQKGNKPRLEYVEGRFHVG